MTAPTPAELLTAAADRHDAAGSHEAAAMLRGGAEAMTQTDADVAGAL